MKTTRRDFLKGLGLLPIVGIAGQLSIPKRVDIPEIDEIEISEEWEDGITFTGLESSNGEVWANVAIDTDMIWNNMAIIDSAGFAWYTNDNGATWIQAETGDYFIANETSMEK